MESFERARLDAYFSKIAARFAPVDRPAAFLITHLLPERPVHIDAHHIPANPAKGEPDHRHFDFRFLFHTSAEVGELQTEEITAADWRYADTIENETLRDRVLEALGAGGR